MRSPGGISVEATETIIDELGYDLNQTFRAQMFVVEDS